MTFNTAASNHDALTPGVHISFHSLKTWPEYFDAIVTGRKTLEIRRNDREFYVGDRLGLREYDPDRAEYTGREACVLVTHILHDAPWVPDGYVAMSIRLVAPKTNDDLTAELCELRQSVRENQVAIKHWRSLCSHAVSFRWNDEDGNQIRIAPVHNKDGAKWTLLRITRDGELQYYANEGWQSDIIEEHATTFDISMQAYDTWLCLEYGDAKSGKKVP